jgi:hypothetical protein
MRNNTKCKNRKSIRGFESHSDHCVNGVVVTWFPSKDPPGVRFPFDASSLR